MEALGPKLRRQRRRLGLTLDELAGRTSISKPYLSLIETGRVVNPPSDEKLRRLEQSLGFATGELLSQAHLQRTPKDVRAVLSRLMAAEAGSEFAVQGSAGGNAGRPVAGAEKVAASAGKTSPAATTLPAVSSLNPEPRAPNPSESYLTGVLKEMAKR